MDRPAPVWVDEVYTVPKYTKYCFVPDCKNDSAKTPKKHFFTVPHKNKGDWCRAVGKVLVPKRPLFICEDHLDVEYDLENYESWKISKGNAKLRPKVPFLKKKSQPAETIIEDELGPSRSSKERCERRYEDKCLSKPAETITEEEPRPSRLLTERRGQQYEDKCVQVTSRPELVKKSIQVKPLMADRAVTCTIISKAMKRRIIQQSDPSQPSGKGSTSEVSEAELCYEPTTTTTSSATPTMILNGRLFMLDLIERKPYQYIGISKKLYWVIDRISNAHKYTTTKLDIIITLYKIKTNDTFSKIGDLFQISQSTLWRMFEKTVTLLSAFFKQFIEWPSEIDIKRNLPGSFTTSVEYANVQAIIDCFEIEIEKPSNPVDQSLTWSEYKHCNTIKYLISATPDGLINFISKGYGGRMSDVALVEESGFLDVVPPSSHILADRGFKHLETTLSRKGVTLLRPPSVFGNKKMTKGEVIQAKLIASLRVHIERVIRRVRIFKLLKPHSVINNKFLGVVDDAVIIACGAINFQTPVIKRE